ncbi:MAG: cyclase family protein [Candidatus Sumerlaeota bacterium]|nr:cyclase family protein [Candidatus Sumerlaeota bacterium]
MLIDISRTLGLDSIGWPGDVEFESRAELSIARGDSANLSSLRLSNHVGTHLDAPLHFVDGAASLDSLPMERFRRPATVAEIPPDTRRIAVEDLTGLSVAQGEAVLFKTANAFLPRDRFCGDYVSLTEACARRLAEWRVGLVGIDYLSVDPYPPADSPAHHILLEAGILIFEDVDLRGAAPGRYTLYCFPLKLHQSNGAPCRAVLEGPASA